jgi:hypothetical protein
VPELVDPELVVPAPLLPEDVLVPEVDAPPMPSVVVVAAAPPVPVAAPCELEHAATQGSAVAKRMADRRGRG